jgi:hypothetical protein
MNPVALTIQCLLYIECVRVEIEKIPTPESDD